MGGVSPSFLLVVITVSKNRHAMRMFRLRFDFKKKMTTFLISHNLQIHSDNVPSFDLTQLSEGLQRKVNSVQNIELLGHPHWLMSITSSHSPQELAEELVEAWIQLRVELGHQANHVVLALGGRKDSDAAPGSPLQKGFWGVDVVETIDQAAFLNAINWESLKGNRPVESVFEVSTSKG